jgi:hypothetical protein
MEIVCLIDKKTEKTNEKPEINASKSKQITMPLKKMSVEYKKNCNKKNGYICRCFSKNSIYLLTKKY